MAKMEQKTEKSTISEFERNVKILQKNRENVPLEELKTKYATGYTKLLNTIKAQAEQIIKDLCFGGLRILKEDADEEIGPFIQRAQAIIDRQQAAGRMREVSRAIFREYDVEKFLNLVAEHYMDPTFREAYGPYFRKHCREIGAGRIYNDIIEMEWNQESGVWVKEENGTFTFTLMLPPKEE